VEVKKDRANQKGGGRRGGEEISERMLEGGRTGRWSGHAQLGILG